MATESIYPVSSSLAVELRTSDKRGCLSLHPAFYVGSWILFSNLTILFNKWLIDNASFRYPVILTFWHMAFASLATQILSRSTTFLDGRHNIRMTRALYMRAVVPIGLLYSGSMVCSNMVYLYLNVAFIQMMKTAAPFSTLVLAWIWGQEDPTRTVVLKILLIVLGVLLASAGEIRFSWIGFVYQLGGLVFESLRVVMIQDLMSDDGASMDPLVSLYYFAPTCAAMNLFVAWATEWQSFQWYHITEAGIWILLLNAVVTLCLNVSSVLLIGKTSGLILHLTGVLKNILLVIASVLIWGTTIAPLQIFGYGIALLGFMFYRSNWAEIKTVFMDSIPCLSKKSHFSYDGKRPFRLSRMTIVTSLSLIIALIVVYSWTEGRHYRPLSVSIALSGIDRLSSGWLPNIEIGGH